jgi:hypothetical protein
MMEAILYPTVFIILLVVIFNTVKPAFSFDGSQSFIVSLCITILAILGMRQYFQGSISVLLVPYVTMGIAILLMLLLIFIGKYFVKKQHPREPDEKTSSEVYDERMEK